jgi:hypothetical protein
MRYRNAIVALCLSAAAAGRLSGLYLPVETTLVPVARLVANLERELARNRKADDVHVRLARLYGMAAAQNSDEVPTIAPKGSPEVWFGHEPNLVPYRTMPPADASRAQASRDYRQKSLDHYRAALKINPNNLLARLGHGWTLEQSGERSAAIREYRMVIEQAWPKERGARSAGLGTNFYTQETAGYLIPLLDPARDAAEIAELRRRVQQLENVLRPITPIAIPLVDEAIPRAFVDVDAQVRFDADGTGHRRRWTWITRDAGWLVYDAGKGAPITSALQWFGNVTFWLFWNNGYEALAALDDDDNGELTGLELRHLAIWRDEDGDAVAEDGEVRPLVDYGIRALSCRYREGDGVLTAAESDAGVRFADGHVRPSYDVLLWPSSTVSTR